MLRAFHLRLGEGQVSFHLSEEGREAKHWGQTFMKRFYKWQQRFKRSSRI